MKISRRDRKNFDLKLRTIKRQLQIALEDIEILQKLRNAETAVLALGEAKSRRSFEVRPSKRNPHGLTRKLILEVLKTKGSSGWENIRDLAQTKHNLNLKKTTIGDNLDQLRKQGLILQIDTDLWEITSNGMRESEQ